MQHKKNITVTEVHRFLQTYKGDVIFRKLRFILWMDYDLLYINVLKSYK